MKYRRSTVPGTSYFFTVVTHNRWPLFAEAQVVAHLQAAIQRVQARRPFVVDAEVVLPDHLHAMWTVAEGDVITSPDWHRMVHPEDLARVSSSMRDHIAGKTPMFESVHRLKHTDGE